MESLTSEKMKIGRRKIAVVFCMFILTTSVATITGDSAKTAVPNFITSTSEISKSQIQESSPESLSYSFLFTEPTLEETTLLDVGYTKITMLGTIALGINAGAPATPAKNVKILLPPKKKVTRVTVAGEPVEVKTNGVDLKRKPIMPYQQPTPLGSEIPKTIDFDSELYTSSEHIPSKIYDDYRIAYCRGYAVLSVTLYPVQYVPSQGTLFYNPEMIVTIELENSDYINQFYRKNPADEGWVEKLVYNPEMTERYRTSGLPTLDYPGGICDPSDAYDYVIITTTANGLDHWETNENLPYNWTSLMEKHETDDGLSCALVTIQEIDVHPDYQNPSPPTPEFDDITYHIREFCKDAYQDWGTQYIFISGDDEWIPARHMDYEYELDVDSDIYWSNLDYTFNDDNDSYWGEEGDPGFDLYAELFIGRITCDTPQDVSNWMKKSFYYADSTYEDYLDNAAFYGGDTNWDCEGDDFIDYSAIKGTDNWLGPFPGDHGPYPSWIGFQFGFETWNSNNPGMEYNLSVRWTGEGQDPDDDGPNPGWQGGSEAAAISGFQTAINNDQVTLVSGIAHATQRMSLDVYDTDWEANYHNTRPFFIFDYGCHCGDMDAADDGVLHSMLFHSDTELAFACVYNTGLGWGSYYDTNSSSALQQKSFWHYMFDTANVSISPQNWQLGKAMAWSKDFMAPTIDWTYAGAPGSWRGIIQGCLLFGDPAQRIKPPTLPDHNIGVQDLDVSSYEPADTDIWVGATLYNNGRYNETDVEVRFLVDDLEVNSTNISHFEKNTIEEIGWWYHTPSFGWETLCVNVTLVPGENVSDDNVLCHEVVYGPDIAVTDIQAPNHLGQGFAQEVRGYIENLGLTNETITVQLIANETLENSTDIYLTSGNSQWVSFMWDGTTSGIGTYDVLMHAVPVANESYLQNQNKSYTVDVFAAIGNILLVDDDNGDTFETWYENALLAAHYIYDIWDRSTHPSPTYYEMRTYTAVIWFTGNEYSDTLNSTDQSNLAEYLDNGGKLFISGQDIGYDLQNDTFYADYLHADFTVDTAGWSVDGEKNDPIGDGLSFGIYSGDGASNQEWPDGIAPISPATVCFEYKDADPHKAGIKVLAGAYRIVYLAFGFEAIDNRDDRTEVMSRSLSWLVAEHDMIVLNLDAPDIILHNETTDVEATIMNGGINNEHNIVVNLTVNGTVENTTTIGTLNAGQSTIVSFEWTPIVGIYLVGVEIQPVPDEEILSNNALNTTVHVIPAPDIWVDPTEFNFQLSEGVVHVDTLTVGNEEPEEGTLEFAISYSGVWGGGWTEQWNHTYGGEGHSQFAQPVGDVDEDGKNETFVGGYASDATIILSYNPAAESYNEEYQWSEGGGIPSGVCVLDLDGDDDLEFAVSWVYGSASGVYAYDWDGAGTLTDLDFYDGVGYDFAYDIYACDYDEDNDTEVLIANWPSATVGMAHGIGTYVAENDILENFGIYHVTALGWDNGSFVHEASWGSGESSTENPMIWSGDTDGDGHIEIIAAASIDTVYALNWNETSWDADIVASSLSSHPYAIVCGDIDRDGIDEIGIGLDGTDAYIYDWDGDSYVQVWHSNYPGEEDIIEAMYFGDADNDGFMELLIGTDDIHVISYTGSVYYEESVITETYGQLSSAIIADMDDDGKNEVKACDILIGPGKEWIFEWISGWLSVDPNQGSINVSDEMDLDVIVNTEDLALGVYNASLVVTSNDFYEPVVYIPVNLSIIHADDVGAISINYPPDTIYAGNCTVNATVENFGTMNQTDVVVNCSIFQMFVGTYLMENFSGSFPPPGWTQEQINEWRKHSGNDAGGEPPEAYLDWSFISGDYAYLDSAPVNTLGALYLKLRFKHCIQHFANSFKCRVLTRDSPTDTWNDVTPWSNPVLGDIGPETVDIDISSDIGSATQVRFEFNGSFWNIQDWYIDDVELYSTAALNLDAGDSVYSAETTVNITSHMTEYVEFSPPWNAIPYNYLVKVFTKLPGDEQPENDMTTKEVTVLEGEKQDTQTTTYDKTVQYSDTVTLEANLTDNSSGDPIEAQTIKFYVDGLYVGSGVTNATGQTTCDFNCDNNRYDAFLYPAGTYTITAEFEGDSFYNASSDTATLTVTNEDTLTTTYDKTVNYLDTVRLESHLVDIDADYDFDGDDNSSAQNAGVEGRTINFSVNGSSVGSDVTDTDGYAYLDYPLNASYLLGEEYTISAEFAGDTYYLASSNTSTLTITDNEPPEITNVLDTPDPQTVGGYVNISCDASDNVEVDDVRVNITYPNSASVNVSMLGSYYYNTTYTLVGSYSYFIWANDTSGNANYTDIMSFQIKQSVLLDGYCNYSAGGTADNVTVEITNTDTGRKWQADTLGNYYNLVLISGEDINTSETLRINAKDDNESINVTDHVVTAGEISAGLIHLDLILDVHYRDLKEFPFYPADDGSTRSVDQMTGAASAQMMLNYLTWNSSINTTPPMTYDNQTLIYTMAHENNTNTSLEYIDADGMYGLLVGEIADNGYGYHFFTSHNDTQEGIALRICGWIDFNVSLWCNLKEGHPAHIPTLIPAYGNYTNWMAIRGVHTNKNTDPYPNGPPENIEFYGFWVNDPLPTGIGENTYKTVDEFFATYYSPLSVEDDPYNGEYVAVSEPPEGFDDSLFYDIDPSFVASPARFSEQEVQVVKRTGRRAMQARLMDDMAETMIFNAAKNAINDIALYDSTLAAMIDDVEPVQTVYVQHVSGPNYCLAVFGSDVGTIVVRINAKNGQLLEFSTSEELPSEYLAKLGIEGTQGVSFARYTEGSLFYPTVGTL